MTDPIMCGPGEPTQADRDEVAAFAAFLEETPTEQQRLFIRAAMTGKEIRLVHTRKGPRWTTEAVEGSHDPDQ